MLKRNYLKRDYILVAVAVILVAVAGYFYPGRQSAKDNQSKLEKEVQVAEIRLIQAEQTADLTLQQQKLSDLQSQLSALISFPQQVSWTELANNLVRSADSNSLQLISLTPKVGAGTEKIGGGEYPKSEYSLALQGDLNDINLFLYDLGRAPFPALKVSNLDLTSGKNGWSAQLTLVILTQPKEESKTP